MSSYLVENRYVGVKRCKRGVFMFNRNDAFVGKSLDLYGEWCDFELLALGQVVKPGHRVIDVGANIGTMTVAFAEMVGPTGGVYAFEPQRRSFYMLCGNVALNGLDNVVCGRMAIGPECKSVIAEAMPTPYCVYNCGGVGVKDDGPGELVQMTTLDALNLPGCDLIKIDIEGNDEISVLRGAEQTIAKFRPVIFMEHGEEADSPHVEEWLREHRYKAWWSLYPYFDPFNFFNCGRDLWPEAMWAASLLCVHEESVVTITLEPYLGAQDTWRKCAERRLAANTDKFFSQLVVDRETVARGMTANRMATMKEMGV